jgi:hypothetical protein
VLEFKEIRDQPAVQKLLLLLPRIMPCMDKALAHVRHVVPFLLILSLSFRLILRQHE